MVLEARGDDGRGTRTLGGAGFSPMDPARPSLRFNSRVIFCNNLVRQIGAPSPTFSFNYLVNTD